VIQSSVVAVSVLFR